MGNHIFSRKIIKLFSSWIYVKEKYRSEIEKILAHPQELVLNGKYPVIWKTRSKFVLLIPLADGTQVVYKAPLKMRSFLRYLFRPSPYGREALNYALFEKLGIPVAEFISAGESRRCFVISNGFLITRYASGYFDGRKFMPGAEKSADTAARDEFVKRNFEYLGKLHSDRIIHGGFTPANLLCCYSDSPDSSGNLLDIKWIDVASCCRAGFFCNRKKAFARDIALFFYYFDFSQEQKLDFIEVYCRSNSRYRITPEEMLELVRKNPVRQA